MPTEEVECGYAKLSHHFDNKICHRADLSDRTEGRPQQCRRGKHASMRTNWRETRFLIIISFLFFQKKWTEGEGKKERGDLPLYSSPFPARPTYFCSHSHPKPSSLDFSNPDPPPVSYDRITMGAHEPRFFLVCFIYVIFGDTTLFAFFPSSCRNSPSVSVQIQELVVAEQIGGVWEQ